MKTTLTAEQSATLIAKGISADKASEIKEYDDEVSQWTHRGAPTFTLTDLLSLLPKSIEYNGYAEAKLNIYTRPHRRECWVARMRQNINARVVATGPWRSSRYGNSTRKSRHGLTAAAACTGRNVNSFSNSYQTKVHADTWILVFL